MQFCVFQCRNLLFIVFRLSADDLLRFFGSRTVERNIDVLLCLHQVENHLRIGIPEEQSQKLNTDSHPEQRRGGEARGGLGRRGKQGRGEEERSNMTPLDENVADATS